MKRLLILLAAAVFLVACSNNEEKSTEPEVEEREEVSSTQETINEQEHSIVLVDNEDLIITLLDSEHVRLTKHEDEDIIILNLEIENKQNRTFNIYLDNVTIDGRNEDYIIGLSDTEIKPNDKSVIDARFMVDILNENKIMKFEEHLSGRFTYSDFEGNREQIDFSAYINE